MEAAKETQADDWALAALFMKVPAATFHLGSTSTAERYDANSFNEQSFVHLCRDVAVKFMGVDYGRLGSEGQKADWSAENAL